MAKFSARYSDRRDAVKRIWVEYRFQCACCKKYFSKVWTYQVLRWDSGMTTKPYIYCTSCANSQDAVVDIVDSDKIKFGIAYIDSFLDYKKLSTRENEKFVLNLLKGLIVKPRT